MEAVFQSFGLVLASEMGDKTQLLALILALRFKKPWTVMAGILVATLLNHGLATYVGRWVGGQVPADYLRYGLGVIFFVFALWILVPDKMDDDQNKEYDPSRAFWTTTVLFFLAEMGDKTQLATVALGAKFQMPIAVTVGTTLGMLGADGLAVVFGERLTQIVPMKMIRIGSSVLFALFGLAVVMGWG